MRIRNGFVSNSSSSSFLIVYKDLSDFDLFKGFRGYSRFIADLKRAEEDTGKAFLKSFLRSSLWALIDDFEYSKNFEHTFERHTKLWDIEELAQHHVDTDYQELIRTEGNKLWSRMEVAFPEDWSRFYLGGMDTWLLSEDAKRKWNELRQKFVDTVREDKAWAKAEKAAGAEGLKLYKALVNKGYKVRAVRYSDEDEEGSHMEHRFMPFVAMCPEGDFWILRENEH